MRYILFFALLTAFTTLSSAQAICDLTIADLPPLHGLRLGTSRLEVSRQYAMTPFAVINRNAANKPGLRNVEKIWFDFYQESLSRIEVDYRSEPEWKDVRHFARSIEQSTKLPPASWVFVDRTEGYMRCDGFSVWISSIRNTFTLVDNFAGTPDR